MTHFLTYGHDAVLEVAETELDAMLGCRFATGRLDLPHEANFDVADGQIDLNRLLKNSASTGI